MPAQIIAEEDRGLGIRRTSDMNVMSTPRAERRHALDEKHAVVVWIICPKDVIQTLEGFDQARPLRLLGDDHQDVDDRLGCETRDCRTAEVLQAERDSATKRRADPVRLSFEHRGPVHVVFHQVDQVLVRVAPALSVMSYALQGFLSSLHHRLSNVQLEPRRASGDGSKLELYPGQPHRSDPSLLILPLSLRSWGEFPTI